MRTCQSLGLAVKGLFRILNVLTQIYICYMVSLGHNELKQSRSSISTFHSHPRHIPNRKVHGANMGPTWALSAPDGPHEPCCQGWSARYSWLQHISASVKESTRFASLISVSYNQHYERCTIAVFVTGYPRKEGEFAYQIPLFS